MARGASGDHQYSIDTYRFEVLNKTQVSNAGPLELLISLTEGLSCDIKMFICGRRKMAWSWILCSGKKTNRGPVAQCP